MTVPAPQPTKVMLSVAPETTIDLSLESRPRLVQLVIAPQPTNDLAVRLSSPRFGQGDNRRLGVVIAAAALDGDFRYANEYQRLLNQAPYPVDARGYVSNPWSVGPAIFWTPLFLTTHGLLTLFANQGSPWPADGYSEPYPAAVTLTTALGGLLFLVFAYRSARRIASPGAAALAALAVFFGSNL